MENVMEATNDFHDWEVLPSNSIYASASVDEIHSGELFQPDYFSLDAQNRSSFEVLEDGRSVGSDKPSWIEPGSDNNPIRYLNKDSGGFWSDSSSDMSDVPKLKVSVENLEANHSESQQKQGGLIGMDEAVSEINENSEVEALGEDRIHEELFESVDGSGNNDVNKIEKRVVVWWKMPIEFLRYCVFRMSPVWTVTVAAAVMGIVIFGRRLYKMKRKTKGLEIKVAFDDKKASQAMSRAVRLNEAFSVMKLVPVIRPSLPAVGVSAWPAMNIR